MTQAMKSESQVRTAMQLFSRACNLAPEESEAQYTAFVLWLALSWVLGEHRSEDVEGLLDTMRRQVQ